MVLSFFLVIQIHTCQQRKKENANCLKKHNSIYGKYSQLLFAAQTKINQTRKTKEHPNANKEKKPNSNLNTLLANALAQNIF